jgi:hypothetical protein
LRITDAATCRTTKERLFYARIRRRKEKMDSIVCSKRGNYERGNEDLQDELKDLRE